MWYQKSCPMRFECISGGFDIRGVKERRIFKISYFLLVMSKLGRYVLLNVMDTMVRPVNKKLEFIKLNLITVNLKRSFELLVNHWLTT